MTSESQLRDEDKHRKLSAYLRISGHCFAVFSLLWSIYWWLLFFYVNAAEEPAGPTQHQLLVASGVFRLFAVLAAFTKSKISWLSVPISAFTFFVQLSYLWS